MVSEYTGRLPLWFVAHESDTVGSSGGVQLCTREYLALVERCGFQVQVKSFRADRSLSARLRRKLASRPFEHEIARRWIADFLQELRTAPPAGILFNRVNAAPLGSVIREAAPKIPRVLLSHGLRIVDDVHAAGASASGARKRNGRRAYKLLGEVLSKERAQRAHFDLVLTLTDEERAIEHWLGSRRVVWIPRTWKPTPILWSPVNRRVGFVGTFSHPPSRQALEAVVAELAILRLPDDFRLRLVGSPASIAEDLSRRFEFVEFIGNLPDAALREEASTWSCFMHPLFVFARGCSTKLAVALGWQIPVLSTTCGIRGYRWREGSIPLKNDPATFAAELLEMSSISRATLYRSDLIRASESMPTLGEVAALVRPHLAEIGFTSPASDPPEKHRTSEANRA